MPGKHESLSPDMFILCNRANEQSILPGLNEILKLLGTKGPTAPEHMNGLEDRGLASAVQPMKKIEPGAEVKSSAGNIPEIP